MLRCYNKYVDHTHINYFQLWTGLYGFNRYRMGNFLTHWGDYCKVLQKDSHVKQGVVFISHNISEHWIYFGHNRMGNWDMSWKYFQTICQ